MPTPEPIRVAVVGATGYTGAELIRWLARHPHVRLTAVTSEQSAGKALADVKNRALRRSIWNNAVRLMLRLPIETRYFCEYD